MAVLPKNYWTSQLTNVSKQIVDAGLSIGKAALHCWMPDDIEYYLCALELVDCKDERIGFLSFSVMPEQIVESFSPIHTMIKTHNGVVTTINDSFSPVDINITGTFGRKFRLLLDYKDPNNSASLGAKANITTLNFGEIAGVSTGVKSGYGMTKVLEHILKHTTSVDNNGKPFYLKFFNYSLNTAYIVDVVNYSFSQSMANNCMWNYAISLRAVAPLRHEGDTSNKLKRLLPNVAANSIANGITNILTGMMNFY